MEVLALVGLGIPLSTFKPFLWFVLLISGIWIFKKVIEIIYKIRNP